MIGIDITDVNRFKYSVERYNKAFNTTYKNKRDIAKFWACYEALIKAENKTFYPKEIKIHFPLNSSPLIEDVKKHLSGTYQLSLSHENNLIVAVALLKRKHCE